MEKTLKITEQTHLILTRFGNKGETYDNIIRRLLNTIAENEGK